MAETAKTPTGKTVPRTIVLAAPLGTYLGIVGPAGWGWTWEETAVTAGCVFLGVLFLDPLGKGVKAANAAVERRSKAAKAKAAADLAAKTEAAKTAK